MRKIGFTTTIPVEIVLAAGAQPVDLNNIFITDSDPERFIEMAHDAGVPRSVCAWIKGLYGVVKTGAVDEVIAVTNGDCSNTHALSELFTDMGVPVHTFAFPFGEPTPYPALKRQIDALTASIGTTEAEVHRMILLTDPVREKLRRLDAMTIDGYVNGFENHLWQVSSTDFNGNLEQFDHELTAFLAEAEKRTPDTNGVRLGFLGVPTIFSDIYGFVADKGGRIVFNETQRQFTIPSPDADYVNRYIDYTYPYDIFHRIEDIRTQVAERKLDGLVHYVQAFCYRQIQDITLRNHLNIPILTVEGDGPGGIDARTKIRIESFIEMLEQKKR